MGLDSLSRLLGLFYMYSNVSKLSGRVRVGKVVENVGQATQIEAGLAALIEFPLYYSVYITLNVRHGKHLTSIQTI